MTKAEQKKIAKRAARIERIKALVLDMYGFDGTEIEDGSGPEAAMAAYEAAIEIEMDRGYDNDADLANELGAWISSKLDGGEGRAEEAAIEMTADAATEALRAEIAKTPGLAERLREMGSTMPLPAPAVANHVRIAQTTEATALRLVSPRIGSGPRMGSQRDRAKRAARLQAKANAAWVKAIEAMLTWAAPAAIVDGYQIGIRHESGVDTTFEEVCEALEHWLAIMAPLPEKLARRIDRGGSFEVRFAGPKNEDGSDSGFWIVDGEAA